MCDCVFLCKRELFKWCSSMFQVVLASFGSSKAFQHLATKTDVCFFASLRAPFRLVPALEDALLKLKP